MYQYRSQNVSPESGHNLFINPNSTVCKVFYGEKNKNTCILARSDRGSVKGNAFCLPLAQMSKILWNLSGLWGRMRYCF